MPETARTLLAIDTSTEMAGLALFDGERASEVTWHAGRNQTVSLMPEIQHILYINQSKLSDIKAVVVAIGPGTFNGLRVGLSVAKGLAYGLGIPIIGIPTLDVVAYPHVGTRAPIRAFVRAGRDRVVFADYRHRNGKWVRLTDLRNEKLDEIVSSITERTFVVGEMTAEQADRLAEHPHVVIPAPALRLRRPVYLAEIGYGRWTAGETDPIESLEPVYVHGTAPAGAAASAGG